MKRNFYISAILLSVAIIGSTGCSPEDKPVASKSADVAVPDENETNGPFEPNWESLAANYETPDWFRDAKFGIFMHWGIMSAINENREYGGSHYGRYMYGPGEFPPEHERSQWARDLDAWHKENVGDQNEFGYKDFIPQFKAEKFDADALVAFYKEIGAKYIVPVAVHHDNFDMYDSSHRWNSVKMGPKRDTIAEWKAAASKHELRFGVSSHLYRSPSFFQTSRKFDGADPEYADLYNSNYDIDYWRDEVWSAHWYERTTELVEKYQPDLLYFDGALPATRHGLTLGFKLAADFYNDNIARHDGKLEAVLNLKHGGDRAAYVWDIERGQADSLQPFPWQTDTDLSGGWFYRKTDPQFTPDVAIGNLVDIVSKNGNLLLNVGVKGDGTLPENQVAVLREMGAWLTVNGEAIYGSRPWLIYGEGPTRITSGAFKEKKDPYQSGDIRFTTKAGALFAMVMKSDQENVLIRSLSSELTLAPGKITDVKLLGSDAELAWTQAQSGLSVTLPAERPSNYVPTLQIEFDQPVRGNEYVYEEQNN